MALTLQSIFAAFQVGSALFRLLSPIMIQHKNFSLSFEIVNSQHLQIDIFVPIPCHFYMGDIVKAKGSMG